MIQFLDSFYGEGDVDIIYDWFGDYLFEISAKNQQIAKAKTP